MKKKNLGDGFWRFRTGYGYRVEHETWKTWKFKMGRHRSNHRKWILYMVSKEFEVLAKDIYKTLKECTDISVSELKARMKDGATRKRKA